MNNREPTYDEISRKVLLKAKEMPCTDFGRRPCQILGVCFEPERDEWYAAAEVDDFPLPYYFRIRRPAGEKIEELIIGLVDYFVAGSAAPYTTWINPDYASFSN